MKFDFINPYIFFVSLFIGLFFVYITQPEPHIIYVYPTIHNHNLIFKDLAGLCHKYKEKKIKCPKDIQKIFDYPIQNSHKKNK